MDKKVYDDLGQAMADVGDIFIVHDVESRQVLRRGLGKDPSSKPDVLLLLSTRTTDLLSTLWDRQVLVEAARQILRDFDPEFVDHHQAQKEIQDSLSRIESLLKETLKS